MVMLLISETRDCLGFTVMKTAVTKAQKKSNQFFFFYMILYAKKYFDWPRSSCTKTSLPFYVSKLHIVFIEASSVIFSLAGKSRAYIRFSILKIWTGTKIGYVVHNSFLASFFSAVVK